MQNSDQVVRIPFTVTAVSSETESHPAFTLQRIDPGTDGWQTDLLDEMDPIVDMDIQLSYEADLVELQLLCHEFKIARRVEALAHSPLARDRHPQLANKDVSVDRCSYARHRVGLRQCLTSLWDSSCSVTMRDQTSPHVSSRLSL